MSYSETESSILVASSCDSIEAPSIVKMILDQEKHPITTKMIGDAIAYPWHIDNKYYETDVLLFALTEKMLLPQHLAVGIQAVILAFDSSQENGLEVLDSWHSFMKCYTPDVNILLCNRCASEGASGVSKVAAQEWCNRKGFELVELDPEIDEEWEAEQDFIETTGIKRVVQALHANKWCNLTLKARKEPTSMQALLHGGRKLSEEGGSGVFDEDLEINMDHLRLHTLPDDLDRANIEQKLNELFGGGEHETDFLELFGELREMKDRVSALPSEQRKASAEQVVLGFWRSIGGDEAEL